MNMYMNLNLEYKISLGIDFDFDKENLLSSFLLYKRCATTIWKKNGLVTLNVALLLELDILVSHVAELHGIHGRVDDGIGNGVQDGGHVEHVEDSKVESIVSVDNM